MLIDFWIAGFVSDAYKLSETRHDWQNIWLVAACIAAAVAVLFIVSFNQNKEDTARQIDGNPL